MAPRKKNPRWKVKVKTPEGKVRIYTVAAPTEAAAKAKIQKTADEWGNGNKVQ